MTCAEACAPALHAEGSEASVPMSSSHESHGGISGSCKSSRESPESSGDQDCISAMKVSRYVGDVVGSFLRFAVEGRVARGHLRRVASRPARQHRRSAVDSARSGMAGSPKRVPRAGRGRARGCQGPQAPGVF